MMIHSFRRDDGARLVGTTNSCSTTLSFCTSIADEHYALGNTSWILTCFGQSRFFNEASSLVCDSEVLNEVAVADLSRVAVDDER